MTLTRKDAMATVLTALVVLVFVLTSQSWDVWPIGLSHRWAAVAITLLGGLTCSLGSTGDEIGKGAEMSVVTMLLAVVGCAALAFAVWAIVTGLSAPLALLVAAIVTLWAGSTLRHAWHPAPGPIAT